MRPKKKSHHLRALAEVFPSRAVTDKEIITDAGKAWYPAQYLINSVKLCWTHLLGSDHTFLEAKCKHCGKIIKGETEFIKAPPSMNYKNHLRNAHRLSPKDNFYAEPPSPESEHSSPEGSQNQISDDKYRSDQSSDLGGVIGYGQVMEGYTPESDEFEEDTKQARYDRFMNFSGDQFSKTQFLTLICVLENMSFNSMDNETIKTLFSSFKFKPKLSAQDITNNIVEMNGHIFDLVRNNIENYGSSLPIYFDSDELKGDNDTKKKKIDTFINSSCYQVLDTPFFSIGQHIYDNKYLVVSLQYCDRTYFHKKTIPLVVQQINTNLLSYNKVLQRNLTDVLTEFPGLDMTTMSVVSPIDMHSETSKELENQYSSIGIVIHDSILNIIVASLIPFFGTSIEQTRKQTQSSSKKKGSIIDDLIDLTNVDINHSIFGKINRCYKEISSRPFLSTKFKNLRKNTSDDLEMFKLNEFQRNEPSSAIEYLEAFISYTDGIKMMNEDFEEESFCTADFEMIQTLRDILSTGYQLIKLLSETMHPQYHNIAFIIITLENDIRRLIEVSQTERVEKELKRYLSDIVACREMLSQDNDILLSSYICPVMLFNNSSFSLLYPDLSLKDIQDNVIDVALGVVGKFLKVTKSVHEKNQINTNHFHENYELVAPMDLFMVASEISDDDNLLHEVIENELRLDFGRYVKKVMSDYNDFFSEELKLSDYEREGSVFINRATGNSLDNITELIDIHLPISNKFLKDYLQSDTNLLFAVVIKYVLTMSTSSYSSALSFLYDFKPANKETLLSEVVNIKTFSSQFNISNIVWDSDDLYSICDFPGLG
ncbi:hypothetical protein C6P45_001429 [Maudiozyma exigua]|uniref:BED-type domain-containing protein n=1 Tax=Maudiozyma exigua TaxID=34358 RepID=A0A9P6W0C6_MAUEX|nr:hypothetical protein C6P45_001429 [Kazachstania exigua]